MMDIESQRKKDLFIIQNYELKIEDNYNNPLSLPENGEKMIKDVHYLSETEIDKKYLNLELYDKICQFEHDDINNEDIYFIKNQFTSDKKNDTLPSTYTNSKNNQEFMINKKRNNKNKRKKEHSKFEKDNVLRKINIHYISFIVKFVNYNLKNLISAKHPLFTNLCYDFKQKINKNFFNELKNKTIGEVLKNEGSNKNKRNFVYQKDDNEKIYNSVYNTILKELLDINYIQFFRQVYMKGSNSSFFENNKKYKLPKKIIFFDDFVRIEILKDPKNGELYKERLKYISKSEFISEKFPFFETKSVFKNRY